MAQPQSHAISGIIADLRDVARDRSKITVKDAIEALGTASHTGLILLPALIAATPLSGIPGLTTVCGLIIALISAQMLFSRDHLWLPDWLLRCTVEARDLGRALDKVMPAIRFLDRHTHARLRYLVTAPVVRLIQGLCLICGLVMPFLEVVPFTGSLMAAVVFSLALSLLAKDGLFAVIGMAVLAVIIGLISFVL